MSPNRIEIQVVPRISWREISDQRVIFCLIAVNFNSGRVKDAFMESALRELAYVTALGQCEIRAFHIAGVINRLPDMLSH